MRRLLSLIVIAAMSVLIPYGGWHIWQNYHEYSLAADPQKQLEETLEKAENGDIEAQYRMALHYHYGDMTLPVDRHESFQWYRKAAEQGHVKAQNTVGVSYELGEGVDQNIDQAIFWYKKASANDNSMASRNLGNLYYRQKDYKNALTWLGTAAEQGDINTPHTLGYMYEHGLGTPENIEKAVEYYTLAAEQGNKDAQINLGILYFNRKDYENARIWMEKAAAQGHAGAYRNLGYLYAQGLGTDIDYIKAGESYLTAARNGDAESRTFLETLKSLCEKKKDGFSHDDHRSIAACIMLAPSGDAEAQYTTAVAYHAGFGVPIDQDISYKWLKESAAQGHKAARYQLDLFEKARAASPDGKIDFQKMLMDDLTDDLSKSPELFQKYKIENTPLSSQNHTKEIIEKFISSQTDRELKIDAKTQDFILSDMNTNGTDELILLWTTLGPTYWQNHLTIFSNKDGAYVPVATLPLTGEAKLNNVDENIIHVDHKLYGENDPRCCPTIEKEIHYQWQQDTIVKVE